MDKNEIDALIIKRIASTNKSQLTLVKRLIKAAIEDLKAVELTDLEMRVNNLDTATDELDELKAIVEKQQEKISALEAEIALLKTD